MQQANSVSLIGKTQVKDAATRSATNERIENRHGLRHRMSTEDPRKIYKQPPYSEKRQPPPGSEEEMSPGADHAESSYKGTGRLKSRSALVTGADSGIGRRLPLPLHERERMLPFLICPKIGMPRRPNVSSPKPVAKPFSCLVISASGSYPRLCHGKPSTRSDHRHPCEQRRLPAELRKIRGHL